MILHLFEYQQDMINDFQFSITFAFRLSTFDFRLFFIPPSALRLPPFLHSELRNHSRVGKWNNKRATPILPPDYSFFQNKKINKNQTCFIIFAGVFFRMSVYQILNIWR
jgi:hypothetical protein